MSTLIDLHPENSNERSQEEVIKPETMCTDETDESDSEDEELSKIQYLENCISDNPYGYEFHIQVIELYEKQTDLKSLREAYKRFHRYFPLTPTIWLNWIKIEINLASTDEQKKKIFTLFDKAVEDYLSVDIWIEYIKYSLTLNDIETTRKISENALHHVGLVCDKGAIIWDSIREIENAHLHLINDKNSEEWKKQVKRLADIFKRQLSVPLMDMENTFDEWKNWSDSIANGIIDTNSVTYSYSNALKLLKIYKPFEDQLLTCETIEETYKIYKEYIECIQDPSAAICLFERAALQLCLVPDFWLDYCNYVFKFEDQALSVCEKALRNCPWDEKLWVIKMRTMENLQKSENTILECFENGMKCLAPNPGLNLWLTYLDYNHRNVKSSTEKIDKLANQAMENVSVDYDPERQIPRYYARILAQKGNMKTVRTIWKNDVLKTYGKGGQWHCWLEYINLEKQYDNDPQRLRIIFQSALRHVENQQLVLDEWLMYERQFGTLTDIMKCEQLYRQIIKKLEQSQYENNLNNHENQQTDTRGTKRKNERNADCTTSPKKSKSVDSKVDQQPNKAKNNQLLIKKDPKTTVFISNLGHSVTENMIENLFPKAINLEILQDRRNKFHRYGYVEFKDEVEVNEALCKDRELLNGRPIFVTPLKSDKTDKSSFKYSTREEKNKLFIKNLPVNKTKTDLEKLYETFHPKNVRLVTKKNGQSKGLAYVEFEDEIQAQEALKLTDQMLIDGNEISVAISAPPPKKDKIFEKNNTEDPIRHARSRLQTSLLPRSLLIKNGEESTVTGSRNSKTSTNSKLSNADFKKMFLKK